MRQYFTPILIVLVLTSGLLLSCGQASTPGTIKTYASKTYGYSFQYPGDYFVDVKDESSLRIANPNREVYITMVITPVPSSVGAATSQEILEVYVDNAKSSDAVYYQEYYLKNEKVLDRDYPAYELVYTHRGKGKQFVWQTRNLIAYRDGKVYDFACSAQETKYAQYSLTLDNIYNSLDLF